MPGPKATMALQTFSDEHSTPAQRAYNILCIDYGADKKLFADVIEKDFPPKRRAEIRERIRGSRLCHDKADQPAYR
jgi:hypothetical protein